VGGVGTWIVGPGSGVASLATTASGFGDVGFGVIFVSARGISAGRANSPSAPEGFPFGFSRFVGSSGT
jgi:hypothetical protein